jgi:hypothetical protein
MKLTRLSSRAFDSMVEYDGENGPDGKIHHPNVQFNQYAGELSLLGFLSLQEFYAGFRVH